MSKINRKFFSDTVRLRLFDRKLKQSQLGGVTVLLDYWVTTHSAKKYYSAFSYKT